MRTLDFGDSSPFFGVVGRPRHLAWPVHAYRITIPTTMSVGRDSLNPFEVVVISILDAVGRLDEAALADETCLPIDLVRNVILRLRDRGLIDDDNVIVDGHRRTWEQRAYDEIYTSALVFRELVEGRLLPFVQLLEHDSSIKMKSVTLGIRTIPRDPERACLGPPSPRDIIEIVSQMKRRSAAHARHAKTPTIEQIRVEREPEDYFLDCPIAIQAHEADYRIADPFGTGFSRVIEEVFSHRLESDEGLQDWMSTWRQNLNQPQPSVNARQRPLEPFDTEQNRLNYPNLLHTLTPASGAQRLSIEDIYACLEWALFYCCEMNDPGLAIRRLGQAMGSDYSPWLSGIAAGVGLDIPRSGFRPIANGKFDDYLNQKPEMETVLAIALVQADADSDHPIHEIAHANPEFLIRIRNLTSDRGDWAHGKHVAVPQDAELESERLMREAVGTLLPDIQFGSSTRHADAAAGADLRLAARTSLLDALGYQTFNRLGLSAQSSLQAAEQFWLTSKDGDDARAFISSLYATLQGVLRSFLDEAQQVACPEDQYFERAAENAQRAGLGFIPPALTTVNPRRIRSTLQGDDPSLGASVIAQLLTSSDEVLVAIAERQPDFLSVVAVIHGRRGHANQPAPMGRDELSRLRRKTLTTVVTLLELTQGD